MSKLQGKVAVVTGSSKGIGAAIAKQLASDGASVVVNYASDKAGAEKTVAEIVKAGGKAIAVGASVTKPEDVEKLFAETKKAYGKVDILVNNAGVYSFAPIEAFTIEEYTRIFDTNVRGLLLTTKAAVELIPAEGGSIINIGSIVSETTPAASSIYTASKGAVDAITRVLARELGARKIRVNALNPGITGTEGIQSAGISGSDFENGLVAQTPLGRLGKPQDLATVASFLASDDAGWVTGALLQAGGGLR
ncbi:3-oxoacyl-[acyl-carrier protein] reductase [Bryocella elongata]|uniref:3-oxoacyl-[acyl-carrier protein] reductase n=1 Tax=Bryocella elongata TaxID=863522 RepID=A0A1H6BKZ8_9BACT|nr:glucose 1-dehydrogenase [Bryocella elongata]SEG61145.1 3-oxoacyl-[acyl-carrier protein] reductase [Bryocella elongata]